MRYSAGARAVPYFERWEDNVLAPFGGGEWPEALLRQVNGYVARRSWFTEDDADALAAHLAGRISKFQSVNSEDAVTWSWFGTLAMAEPGARRDVLQWMYDRLGLGLTASDGVAIDQWPRVFHPNVPGSRRGPELDARIDDSGVAVVYVEAKWDAGLGTGRGAVEGVPDDQILLRRDSLRADPGLAGDDRRFVVLCVSNTELDLAVYEESARVASLRPVDIAWISWTELARCDAHPLADIFRNYLDWKRRLAAAGLSRHRAQS